MIGSSLREFKLYKIVIDVNIYLVLNKEDEEEWLKESWIVVLYYIVAVCN